MKTWTRLRILLLTLSIGWLAPGPARAAVPPLPAGVVSASGAASGSLATNPALGLTIDPGLLQQYSAAMARQSGKPTGQDALQNFYLQELEKGRLSMPRSQGYIDKAVYHETVRLQGKGVPTLPVGGAIDDFPGTGLGSAAQMESRLALAEIRRSLGPDAVAILSKSATGLTSAELGAQQGTSAAAIRKRAERLEPARIALRDRYLPGSPPSLHPSHPLAAAGRPVAPPGPTVRPAGARPAPARGGGAIGLLGSFALGLMPFSTALGVVFVLGVAGAWLRRSE